MSEVLHEIKLRGGICAASTVEVDNMLHLNMDLDASQASLGLPMGATFFPVDVVVNIKVCIPRFLYIYVLFIMIWHHSVCPWEQKKFCRCGCQHQGMHSQIFIYICHIYNDLASLGLPLGATFFPVGVVVNTKVYIPRFLYIYMQYL